VTGPSASIVEGLRLRCELAFAAGVHEVHIVRDATVQALHPPKLTALRDEIRSAKIDAINANDAAAADYLLGMQALTDALLAEFEMVRLVKDAKPHEAWAALVTAQENVRLARRTQFARGEGAADYENRLACVEKALFPTPVFVSAGFLHRGGKCTICNAGFDSCTHLEGQIYCGRVCAEVDYTHMELDHVAIVAEPRDRRCYLRNFQNAGGATVDIMTRLASPGAPDASTGDAAASAGRKSEAVLFHNQVPPGVLP
jgi:hypothetical protein